MFLGSNLDLQMCSFDSYIKPLFTEHMLEMLKVSPFIKGASQPYRQVAKLLRSTSLLRHTFRVDVHISGFLTHYRHNLVKL